MKEKLRFLGLDVHAEAIAVAIAEPEREVRSLGTIPNRAESIRKLIRKLGPAEKLRACYEAGPTGYVVYWQLAELGVQCEVVAPTLVPVTRYRGRSDQNCLQGLALWRLRRRLQFRPHVCPNEVGSEEFERKPNRPLPRECVPFSVSGGQQEGKSASFANRALQFDIATVRLDNMTRHREAYSNSPKFSDRVSPHKLLKNTSPLRNWNS
jgi:hypothetical protein